MWARALLRANLLNAFYARPRRTQRTNVTNFFPRLQHEHDTWQCFFYISIIIPMNAYDESHK